VTAATAERLRAAVAAHAAALRRAGVATHPAKTPLPGPGSDQRRAYNASDALTQVLGGTWFDTPAGPVFVRDEWYELDHLHGARAVGDALAVTPAGARLLTSGHDLAPSRYAYFDIETTGLSRGAGTYVVLAGVGSFERPARTLPLSFRVRQFFLADIGAERAMLVALADELARFDGLVTYNGRSFDVPVVETRLTLARLRAPWCDRVHLDLLHAVRRLYRHRLPGCRLAEAERCLLRFERPDDMPGWLVPQAYFDYIRAGRLSPLRLLFRHNRDDVLSLAALLGHLVSLVEHAHAQTVEDALAIAHWLERSDEAMARMLYERMLPLIHGAPDWPWAAARLARLLRRAGRPSDAAALWRRLWVECRDTRAALDLAKHLEHRERNFAEAAALVSELRTVESFDGDDLLRREARLRRRCATGRASSERASNAAG